MDRKFDARDVQVLGDPAQPTACSYCRALAGYVAACGAAAVRVCKRHVGAACAVWLYDQGLPTVQVRRLRRDGGKGAAA